jgi:hypothetical protein
MAAKGGVTVCWFHCVFNGHGFVTHFKHDFDRELCDALPHLYAVCLASSDGRLRRVDAGFIVKTSYCDRDPGFRDALSGVVMATRELSRLVTARSSLLPTRVAVSGEEPLMEDEMLSVLIRQRRKHAEWNDWLALPQL